MPIGSEVVTVAAQGQSICVWAVVDTEQGVYEERKFHVYGTGHELPENHEDHIYIGTVFIGHLVFHVYEGKK